MDESFRTRQTEFCKRNDYNCDITAEHEKLGFAKQTLGQTPINGLRHPREDGTSGWFIWCGEEFSTDDHFFDPLHAAHLQEYCPAVIELLGLPPGFRFLKAGDHLDIWFDESLLDL
jgi:hypothetical protein